MNYLLILTFNRLEAVQHCFASLTTTLARRDVACLVLDNGSTDGTLGYLSERDDIQLIACHENLGVAGGRAILLEMVMRDMQIEDRVVFLDSDTEIVSDDWLDVLARALEPESVGVVGPFGSYVKDDWSGFAAGRLGEVDTVAGACQMWRGELFKHGLRVDTDLAKFWHEDSSMCLAVRDMGYDVVCVGVGVAHYPAHSGYGQDEGLHDANFAKLRTKWQGKQVVKAEGAY